VRLRKKPTRTGGVRYLIEVPHTADECLWVMDELLGRGPFQQYLFWWGCSIGEHSAWALIEASGRGEALEEVVPPTLRRRAIVRRLARVDIGELLSRHKDEAA
jgi:hypothetical protein